MIKIGDRVLREELKKYGFTNNVQRLSERLKDKTVQEDLWITESNNGRVCVYRDIGNKHCIIEKLEEGVPKYNLNAELRKELGQAYSILSVDGSNTKAQAKEILKKIIKTEEVQQLEVVPVEK